MLVLRVLVFAAGVMLVVGTVMSAVRTFVVPRAVADKLSRQVFLTVRKLFDLRLKRIRSYAERDRMMATYAPLSLLSLPIVWLTLVIIGYTAMFWAVGVRPLFDAFKLSGSSVLTLGFSNAETLPATILAFSEAAIGLIMVALLISYLPTMYNAFSRRESAVALLQVRAGSPPSAVEMLLRFHRLDRINQLNDLWTQWELWFTEIEETHTSLAALAFFRSPQPESSWVTAAGTILDAAALMASAVAVPRNAQAELCIRAGFIALRRIAALFRFTPRSIPKEQDHTAKFNITISRADFDAAYDELMQGGLPMKPDRDQCWLDFAGWRVTYDDTLIFLCILTMAPAAKWSSDRVRKAPPAPTPEQAAEVVKTIPAAGQADS